MAITKCANCGRTELIYAKGLCAPCYQWKWSKNNKVTLTKKMLKSKVFNHMKPLKGYDNYTKFMELLEESIDLL